MIIFNLYRVLDSKSLSFFSLSDISGLQQIRITLVYGIRTPGFDAEDIISGTNNNIAESLIDGVTTVILSLLNDSDDESIFLPPSRRMTEGLELNKKQDKVLDVHPHKAPDIKVFDRVILKQPRRNLATYLSSAPPFLKDILQDGKKKNSDIILDS